MLGVRGIDGGAEGHGTNCQNGDSPENATQHTKSHTSYLKVPQATNTHTHIHTQIYTHT